jgi:hypothetical protein
LVTIAHADLIEGLLQIPFHGAFSQTEPLSDPPVRQAGARQEQNFDLARAEFAGDILLFLVASHQKRLAAHRRRHVGRRPLTELPQEPLRLVGGRRYAIENAASKLGDRLALINEQPVHAHVRGPARGIKQDALRRQTVILNQMELTEHQPPFDGGENGVGLGDERPPLPGDIEGVR